MTYDAANAGLSPLLGHVRLDALLIESPGDVPLGDSRAGPGIDLPYNSGFLIMDDVVAFNHSITERSTAAGDQSGLRLGYKAGFGARQDLFALERAYGAPQRQEQAPRCGVLERLGHVLDCRVRLQLSGQGEHVYQVSAQTVYRVAEQVIGFPGGNHAAHFS